MRIIFFILLLIPKIGFTQDPQLLENDWYVQKVVIENLDYYPPSGFVGRIYFFNDHMEVQHHECAEGFFSYYEYINNVEFSIEDGGVVDIGICSDPDIIFFMEKHYFVFFYNFAFAKNPFAYTIVNENDLLILTVTNMDGDQAIYINELLSNIEFNSISIRMFPNPVHDILSIESSSIIEINKIKIYDILGRLIVETDSVEQIDVSRLNSGILFVKIETDQGNLTKKVVKL